MEKEFSIKKEIEIQVKENLDNLDIDLEQVYDDVVSDELMLDMITLSIYNAISGQLKLKGIQNEAVNEKIIQKESFIVKTLMNREII